MSGRLKRAGSVVALLAAGFVGLGMSGSLGASPPCWSSSPHKVCPPSTTTVASTTVPVTTTAPQTTTAATTTAATTTVAADPPYLSEHYDGGLNIANFWYFSPLSWTPSFVMDGVSGQAVRVTDCAATAPGQCVDGSSSSRYGQLVGVESTVQTAQCVQIHAGYSTGDCSTSTAVGKLGDDTWYHYHVRFPAGYQATPGTQNTTFEVHVDRGSEADATGGNIGSNAVGVAADGDPAVLCPGSPNFCTTAGTNPHLFLQVTGGQTAWPLYGSPGQAHRYTDPNALLLGHWYDVLLHYTFSPDPLVGHVQWWVDGTLEVDVTVPTQYQRRNGSLGYGEDVGTYNYRYWASWASSVDYDELVSGPTRASVGG